MAAELFVDTSGWYALAVTGSVGHGDAVRVLEDRIERGFRVVTTNLVVAETYVLLLRRAGRAAALGFLRHVAAPPNEVVTSVPVLEDQALRDWLLPFQDQAFSLADAVSFVVMKSRGIREALALDRHFETAGFVVVPRLE